MQALANVPAYISSVFQKANALNAELAPAEIYNLINRRISDLQAQLYLLRLEMDNRFERDPANLYEDPLAISTYGERLSASVREPREFKFEPSLIAHGWHQTEGAGENFWRWMRPGQGSVVCFPHMGKIDQLIEIWGHVLDPEQLLEMQVRCGDISAEIEASPTRPEAFVARLKISSSQVQSANILPVEFQMTDFRQPSETDTRLLGACVTRFRCSSSADLTVRTAK